MPTEQTGWKTIRGWFAWTPSERLLFAGLLLVVVVGLTARYLHLRGQTADVYQPEGAEAAEAAPSTHRP